MMQTMDWNAVNGGEGSAPTITEDECNRVLDVMRRGAEAMRARRPAEAVALFEEGRALCEAHEMTPLRATVLFALSGAHLEVGESERSLQNAIQSAELAATTGAWEMAHFIWLCVGHQYLMREELDLAAAAHRHAVEMASRAGPALEES